MTDTVTPDLCPIHTLDEAVIWLSLVGAWVDFDNDVIDVSCTTHNETLNTSRIVGAGGFDARGTLMMATRDLWAKVNKAVKA